MQLAAPHHNTRTDTGRWVDVPGYLAPIDDPRERRQHRANLRGKGLAEQRLEAGEPSPHQLASLVTHAVAIALILQPKGQVADIMARAMKLAAEHEGWDLNTTLKERVGTRMRLGDDEIEYVQAQARGRVTGAEREITTRTMRERRLADCRLDLARRRNQSLAAALEAAE